MYLRSATANALVIIQQTINRFEVLKRVLTLTPEGLVYDADPRHIELVPRSLNLTECGKTSKPDHQIPFDEAIDHGRELDNHDAVEGGDGLSPDIVNAVQIYDNNKDLAIAPNASRACRHRCPPAQPPSQEETAAPFGDP